MHFIVQMKKVLLAPKNLRPYFFSYNVERQVKLALHLYVPNLIWWITS
jgi:hypothetical protein